MKNENEMKLIFLIDVNVIAHVVHGLLMTLL